MNTLLLRLVACLLLSVSLNSFGALSIRDLDGDWSNGHEGVYDDVLNITWMADANAVSAFFSADDLLQRTQSGDFTYLLGGDARHAGGSGLIYGYNGGSGYLGINSWRLPHAAPVGGSEEYLEGELSYNYHMNLGGVDCFGDIAGCTNQTGLDNQSLFVNLSFFHWTDSGEFFQEGLFCPCAIVQVGSSQTPRLSPEQSYKYWVVADGDFGTSAVPIPATAWLFGSALAGLLVVERKR